MELKAVVKVFFYMALVAVFLAGCLTGCVSDRLLVWVL